MFATLAAQGPHLMLLDEPTNHLDIYAIASLIEGLKAAGQGMVIISHNQSMLSQVCDQVYVVHDKHITIHEGSFSEYKDSIIEKLLAAEDDSE